MVESRNVLQIKICGMQDQENLDAVCTLKPEMVGFIFYPKSPRYVFAEGRRDVLRTPDGIDRVGVFVNTPIEELSNQVSDWGLTAVQLHGEESVEYCKKFKQRFPEVLCYKVFRVSDGFSVSAVSPYQDVCDGFLFDTDTKGYGGSGKVFSWEVLEGCPGDAPMILSGGLSEETYPGLKRFLSGSRMLSDRVKAVDFNSGVETGPGMKSVEMVRRVIEMVRRV